MERIKNGYQGVIPSICVEVFQQTKSQEEFGIVRPLCRLSTAIPPPCAPRR